MPLQSKLLCLLTVILFSGFTLSADDLSNDKLSNWHRFRGPDGNGVAPLANPPTEWSTSRNLKWKTEIPGKGISSPIVWGDKIFLTTAIQTDRKSESAPSSDQEQGNEQARGDQGRGDRAQQGGRGGGRPGGQGRGGRRGGFGGPPPTNYYEFVVLCIDRANGDVIWKTTLNEAVPHESGHGTNTFASGSPTTDGNRVYVNFGSFGVYCLDMDGNIIWKRDLGKMQTRNSFGEGASATIHGDTLVVPFDHEGQSFIEALDASTGETRWKVERDERTTWATPLVVEHDGRAQVITNGTNRVRSYDLKSGELIWECGGQASNPIPSPLLMDGVTFCMTGYRGFAIYAIPLDAKGDITGSDKIVWSRDDAGPYVASGVLYKSNIYYTKSRDGILASVDAKTGDTLIQETRLPDISSIYASLVAANDRIYVTGRDGTTNVLKHGPEFEVLATNEVGEPVDATPALVDNQIIIRGHSNLFCFENSK